MKKRQTGEERKALLKQLIDFISEPVALFNFSDKSIIFANDAFYFLTGTLPEEVVGNQISDYFSFGDNDNFHEKTIEESNLRRKLLDPITVSVTIRLLENVENIALIKVKPQGNQSNKLFLSENIFLKDIEFLVDSTELEQAYERALVILRSLCKSDFICIYQIDHNHNYLSKAATLEPDILIFPAQLPISDFARLSQSYKWTSKDSTITEIHTSAKAADLLQVITYPLGNENSLFGLIAIGWGEKPAEEFNKAHLIMIVNMLSRYYKNTLIYHNLEKLKFDLEHNLTVRNSQMENIRQGLLVVQPDFNIAEINNAAELMLGFSDREVNGQPVENVIIGAEGLMSALKTALSGVGIHDIGNFSIHRRDGQTVPVKIQALPVLVDNHVVSMLIIIDDISERQQYQLRAQHLEQRAILGEFSAVFAHEVRNPVNNISTGLQLLETKLSKDDPNLGNINRMQADCQRINHLMESVLAFSRPIEPAMENIDLIFLLQRVLDKWHPRFMKVKVEPYFQFDGEIPRINGDSRSLERVFINLIGNAVEAMKDTGGILSVKMRVTSELAGMPHVEIAISDTGPGIPDEIKEDIFKPFVSTTTNGTGLGLAISYRIVTGHKGTMKFKTFPGGTVFFVYLPIKYGEKIE